MKVLLIGGGGREHALGWKIAQSPLLTTLYLAPGNPSLNQFGVCIDLKSDDHEALVAFARTQRLDLVVIGPEAPLAAGLADRLDAAGVACFGVSQAAAQLEASKAFAKEILAASGAPTAACGVFDCARRAKAYLDAHAPPYVIKADGLAAGKGVVIAATRAEADEAVDTMLGGALGSAGARILIEDFLEGEEASFFVLCDGAHIAPLIAVQDHKRAYDGDRGPNTGGMGAYAPAPVFTEIIRTQTLERIVKPVVREMARRGTPYRGVLFVGLMIGTDGPKVVEFNVRFGDPECQVMMRLFNGDILPLLHATATGRLDTAPAAQWSDGACALVVLAAEGYPGKPRRGGMIEGVEAAERLDGVVVFNAGAALDQGRLIAEGGRVLNVSAVGRDLTEAVARAYAGVDAIHWPGSFHRRDIGWRALKERA